MSDRVDRKLPDLNAPPSPTDEHAAETIQRAAPAEVIAALRGGPGTLASDRPRPQAGAHPTHRIPSLVEEDDAGASDSQGSMWVAPTAMVDAIARHRSSRAPSPLPSIFSDASGVNVNAPLASPPAEVDDEAATRLRVAPVVVSPLPPALTGGGALGANPDQARAPAPSSPRKFWRVWPVLLMLGVAASVALWTCAR